MTAARTRYALGALIIGALLVAIPFTAHAQSADADLRASIRAEILKDPRSASMSEAEIEALVAALSQGAQAEGIESRQFTAQSNDAAPAAEQASSCDGMPGFLCTINKTLGFDGSSALIPIALLATSGLLAFLLWEMRRHAHVHGHPPLQ